MKSRRGTLLTHSMWGIGGLALGATAVILFEKGFSSDWVEATGTWFGAIATVLALLWAVQAFRSDQTSRAEAQLSEQAERDAMTLDLERTQAAEAAQVLIGVQPFALTGSGRQLSSVSFNFANNTKHRVTIVDFGPLPPLAIRANYGRRISIDAGDDRSEIVTVMAEDEVAEQLGRDGVGLQGWMKYNIEGIMWVRESGEAPRRA
jgi:hypothetical protein